MELDQSGTTGAEVSAQERAEEQKLIRRLQLMMNMVMQVIAQDATADGRRCVPDDRRQQKGRAGHVSRKRAGLRSHLEASVSAPDARTFSNHVTLTHSKQKGPPAGGPFFTPTSTYFLAVANRLFTSSQFTTFHHAAR